MDEQRAVDIIDEVLEERREEWLAEPVGCWDGCLKFFFGAFVVALWITLR